MQWQKSIDASILSVRGAPDRQQGAPEIIKSQITKAPFGVPKLTAPWRTVSVDPRMWILAEKFRERTLDLPGAVQLGRLLGEIAYGREDCVRLQEHIDSRGTSIRFTFLFDPDDRDVLDLPWELIRVDSDARPLGGDWDSFPALRTGISIVRQLTDSRNDTTTLQWQQAITVLCSPERYPPELDIKSEERAIAKGLKAARAENRIIEIIECKPYRKQLADMVRADGRSIGILHFGGHGMRSGIAFPDEAVLLLEEEAPHDGELTARDLAHMCSRANVGVAVLNACETALTSGSGVSVASALFHRGLPAVVAMQRTIKEDASCLFAETFYRRLASGDTLDTAMIVARSDLHLANRSLEAFTPVLYRHVEHAIFSNARSTPPLDRPGVWKESIKGAKHIRLTFRRRVVAVFGVAAALFALAWLVWGQQSSRLLIVAGLAVAILGAAATWWRDWLLRDRITVLEQALESATLLADSLKRTTGRPVRDTSSEDWARNTLRYTRIAQSVEAWTEASSMLRGLLPDVARRSRRATNRDIATSLAQGLTGQA